jgi:DNA-binding HxlR family transcriptional regulator
MIHAGGVEYCIDPAGDLLRVLGKTWTLPLVGVLGNLPAARFSDLSKSISGIGARVLSQRLRELTRLGLVRRTVRATAPVHVEYHLTRAGVDVHQALVPLLATASRFPHRGPAGSHRRAPTSKSRGERGGRSRP